MYGSVNDSHHNSNLLYFYVSILRRSRQEVVDHYTKDGRLVDKAATGLKAHVLSDSGASHKFVRPSFVMNLEKASGYFLPTKESSTIKITTANVVVEVPLKKVELMLDMGGYQYTGWFIVFDLVKYDIVLGKEWLAEVEHDIDHK